MTHASNVLGTVQPIETIAAIVRESRGLVPGRCGPVGRRCADRLARDADRLAGFPGHKALYGPTGTGALYVGPRTDGKLRALARGGNRRRLVEPDPADSTPVSFRGRHTQCAGRRRTGRGDRLGGRARAGELCGGTRSNCFQHVVDWAHDSDGWKVAGRWDALYPRRRTLRSSPRRHSRPQDLGAILDTSFDIAVRPGLHCAPYIHRALGTFPDGTLRLSPGPFTTRDDIATFLTAFSEITAGVL